jgi:2-methylcitrate dehydratase PrpD
VSRTTTAAVADLLTGDWEPDATTSELACLHVLDTVAAVVACRDLEAARVGRAYALAVGGSGGTTILGTTQRTSMTDAAFAGAMAGHAAEVNDFMPAVFVQPGPAVVATALAVAEHRDRPGDALVRAVIGGYELAYGIPRALGAGNLRRAGLASHGVGPVFGAAAAATMLLGLPSGHVGDVLSCCAQQASGSWQWLRDVEHIEKAFVFAGMGARNGLQAALLVEAGFRGVPDAFDDPDGWFRAPPFDAGDRDDTALAELDRRDALTCAAFKRHPVGGPAQPAVDALLELADELDAEQVQSVVIAMPGRVEAFRDAAMPALNLRYLSAVVLLDRCLDVTSAQALDRFRRDERVAELMQRVEVVHDPGQESGTGADRTESARVTVTLRSGEVRTRFVASVPGFPGHPMTAAEVEDKARSLLAPRLGDASAEAVIAACRDLPGLARAADLIDLVAR